MRWAVVVVSLAGVLGCSAAPADRPSVDDPGGGSTQSPAESRNTTPSPSSTRSTPSASPSAGETSRAPHPVSLPALMRREYDGRGLRVGDVIETTDAYTRHHVTYRSGDLTISGIMNVPEGSGPFPVLVLAHGYIDPDVYTTGRGLRREQDHLARQGYAVLHTDYRNHAGSDDDPRNEVRLRLGYTEDVINAVLAVRASTLPYLDGSRVGLLGRSMGGGVVLNTLVVQPGLVDAAVVYASVSSRAADNFERWTRGLPERADLARQIIGAYGAPENAPAFWRAVSPVTFFGRVSEPVLIHHGTADDTCPVQWAHDTHEALRRAAATSTLQLYEDEQHAFTWRWQDSIERTTAFFDRYLGA